MKATISVREFADAMGMTVSVPGRTTFEVETSDVYRPGLQFAGYFRHFTHSRVQVCGNAEMTYLSELSEEELERRMEAFFAYDIPVLCIARGFKAPEVMARCAKARGIPILRFPQATTKLIHRIANFLDQKLAPCITRHGGLLDIYGVGIMLSGESGVGKSETALELVKRGHRLVADDVVEIRRTSDNELTGRAPELIRHLMELRGIGIVDVRNLYGIGAVRDECEINLLIEMEDWDEHKEYDRLGMDEKRVQILDVAIPSILLPVRPGRNLAIIVEVAARNFRLKQMGFDAAKEFDRRLTEQMQL